MQVLLTAKLVLHSWQVQWIRIRIGFSMRRTSSDDRDSAGILLGSYLIPYLANSFCALPFDSLVRVESIGSSGSSVSSISNISPLSSNSGTATGISTLAVFIGDTSLVISVDFKGSAVTSPCVAGSSIASSTSEFGCVVGSTPLRLLRRLIAFLSLKNARPKLPRLP